MKPYADTNLIVSLFCEGPNKTEAEKLHKRAVVTRSSAYPVTLICRLEIVNALQQAVFATLQGVPGMRVSREYAMVAEAIFFEQLVAGTRFKNVSIDERLLERQFQDIAHRYTAKEGFRTYDILHVSCALVLGCDTFWSFDGKARKLAKLEGLALN